MLTLENITIPTPAPYSADDPFAQHENLCYVFLQILQGLQTEKSDIDLGEAVKDLAMSGYTVDVPALGLKLSKTGKAIAIIEK